MLQAVAPPAGPRSPTGARRQQAEPLSCQPAPEGGLELSWCPGHRHASVTSRDLWKILQSLKQGGEKIQRVLVGIYLTPAHFSSSQFALSLDFFPREPRSSWLVLKTPCSQRCCWHEHCLLRAQPLPQTLRGLSVRPWPALGGEGPPAFVAALAAVARPCSSCLAGVKVRLQMSVVLPLCQACREKVGAPCLLSCAGGELEEGG